MRAMSEDWRSVIIGLSLIVAVYTYAIDVPW